MRALLMEQVSYAARAGPEVCRLAMDPDPHRQERRTRGRLTHGWSRGSGEREAARRIRPVSQRAIELERRLHDPGGSLGRLPKGA